MIEMFQTPDHVLAVRLSGDVTGPDFDQLTAALEARLARHRRIGIVADLADLDALTLEALGKDIRYNFAKHGEWARFPREAVITSSNLMRAAIRALDPLAPEVEVRSFAPAEREVAVAWASEIDPES